jgi:hypothetical protein
MTTTPVACPGRENHAWRQAETARVAHGTPHDLSPRWGDPVHCAGCTTRAHRQLAELPELVAAIWLEATHGSHSPQTGTIGRIGGGIPAWPGQASRLLTDHIVGGLTELEDDWRGLRGLTPRTPHGSEGVTLTATTRFLAAHLDWALTHHPAATEVHDPDSANPAAQIAGWHRAAERFTARDNRLTLYQVPCPRCTLLTLCKADGDEYIACRNPECEVLLTSAEYLDHVRTLAAATSRNAA